MSIHRPRRIDRDTAEALLRGAPAARRLGGPLGEHLAAAAAPAHRHELAGRPVALAAFQAARLQPATRQRRTSMTKIWLAKLLTVKAAALLAVTAAGGVALAATTGTLPNPLASLHAAGHAGGAPTTTPSHAGGPSALPSPSLLGLCHAYTTGAGAEHGKALANPAFGALITAAGGADKVDGYCKALLASAPAGAASRPGIPADTAHPAGITHPTGTPVAAQPTSTPVGSPHPTGVPTERASRTPTTRPGH